MNNKSYVFFIYFISATQIFAQERQTALVKGRLQNEANGTVANEVQVTIPYLRMLTATDGNGDFHFSQVPYGTYNMVVTGAGFMTDTFMINVAENNVDLGTLTISINEQGSAIQIAQIPTLLIDDNNFSSADDGISSQNFSGLLTAARDPYQNTAAFLFGPYRFQVRGYDRNMQQVFINRIPMNDVETGDAYWSQWGGLNDVFRGRNSTYGLMPADYAFGGVNGAVDMDATALNQSKQTRITYSNSNRQYRNRLMLTHSSGLLKNGWSYSLSFGKRWSKEGYVEGTFYDAYSYYGSVTKKIGLKHKLSFTGFGAPTRRGKQAPAVQEVYDITGDNYYNPNWGYQNGEKRNAKIANYFQPIFILNHDFTISSKTKWITALGYQFGKNANSTLDWYNGADPRPDYYRYLPSWQLFKTSPDPNQAAVVRQDWQTDINTRQINWDELYNRNFSNYETIQNVNGITGNNVYGRRSVYVIGSDVDDLKKYMFNSYLQHSMNENITLFGGITFLNQHTESYRRLDDLMGGDFYINYNQFAERQFLGNTDYKQNDLENPNRIIKQGDKYSYNYHSYFTKANAWVQSVLTYNKVDFFIALTGGINNFHREGLYRNGLYPSTSFGDGEKQNFTTYGAKGGITYKINGRHYLFINGSIMQDAPTFDNTYISPRTRSQTIDNPTEQKTYTAEGGYLLKAPNLNARLVGYVTDVKNATEIKRFYNGDPLFQSFVNYVLQNVDMRFTGLEMALEYKLNSGISITGVAALGQAFYSNRPKVSIYQDNDTSTAFVARTVYLKDYYLAVGPQSAYSLGIKYSSKNYWFGTLSINYFDRNYVEAAPELRTQEAADKYIDRPEMLSSLFAQEKLPSFFTVDLFIYKSVLLSKPFKFLPRNTYLYLSIGVNNLLNNKNIKTGGFENLRYDFRDGNKDLFPEKYFIGYGRNYFANISLKF